MSVVTRDGDEVKLNGVHVGLYHAAELERHLVARKKMADAELAALKSSIDATKAELDRLQKERSSAFQKTLDTSGVFRSPTDGDRDAYLKAEASAETAGQKWNQLMRQQAAYKSSAFYLDQLPVPVYAATTDAEGRFQMRVPGAGRFALAAHATRVAATVEQYYWVLPLKPSTSAYSVMLCNTNTTSSGSADSMLLTP